MGLEKPKKYTPEEMAEMEKERTLSDADLLQHGGAEYQVDKKGGKKLLVPEEIQERISENLDPQKIQAREDR